MVWSAEQQAAACQKLHTRVEMPEVVRLERFLAEPGALPPLPGAAAAEPGKENEQQAANADVGSPRAGTTGALAEAQRELPARPLGGLQPRAGGSFYGGGSGSAAAASSGLLSPVGVQAATPFLRRRGTPAAFRGARCVGGAWHACWRLRKLMLCGAWVDPRCMRWRLSFPRPACTRLTLPCFPCPAHA